ELGVLLDGQKVNLLPILIELLQTSPHTLNGETLAKLPEDAILPVPLPDGRTLPFPASRARQMLGVLLELLDPNTLDRQGRLRLNKLRAAELAGEADWRWLGNAELSELSRRLRSFDGIKPVAPPPTLHATLRPYQQEGLNWLQFLREYELAGILADDMGLGKTVEALAHLLAEKESGRADRPNLVVAPTSLMTNWRQETERFAPALLVLVLHGLARKAQFDLSPAHREGQKRRTPQTAGPPRCPVHSAAAQRGSDEGTPAQDRDRAKRRTGRRATRPLRKRPPGHARARQGRGGPERPFARAHHHPGRPAQAPANL